MLHALRFENCNPFFSFLLSSEEAKKVLTLKEGIPKTDDSHLLGTNKESFKNDISVVFNFLTLYFIYNGKFALILSAQLNNFQ